MRSNSPIMSIDMPVSHVHSPILTFWHDSAEKGSAHLTSGNGESFSTAREYHCTDAPIVFESAFSTAPASPVSPRASRP